MTDSPSQFQAYAVTSRSGPHVTMQAGVVHANRFWTTTAATSLKARSVRAHGQATAVVADGDEHRIVSGRTVALQPLRPWRSLADPVAGLLWSTAVARLGRVHLEQIYGYFEASGSIPAEWLPTRRVLLVTRIDRSLTLRDDRVVDRTGEWEPARPVDLSESSTGSSVSVGSLPLSALAEKHGSAVRSDARAHVGVSTPTGPVALPGRWCGDDRFSVSASALVATSADVHGPASVVFDRSGSRRPDEKIGVLFRGTLRLVDVDGDRAVVAIASDRVTTWDGFTADTVDVGVAASA